MKLHLLFTFLLFCTLSVKIAKDYVNLAIALVKDRNLAFGSYLLAYLYQRIFLSMEA